MRRRADRARWVRDDLPMTMLGNITNGFSRWIDSVAKSIDGLSKGIDPVASSGWSRMTTVRSRFKLPTLRARRSIA
jgi:hypothetical protein